MGFLDDAFRDAQPAKVRKASPKKRQTRNWKRKRPTSTNACDLCGRNLGNSRDGRPYKLAQWCFLCLKNHQIYPTRCVTCDGYHFPSGVTDLLALEHILELRKLEHDEQPSRSSFDTENPDFDNLPGW